LTAISFPPDAALKVCPHTAVKALCFVGREHGLDVLPDQLLREHVIGNAEVDDHTLVEIAAEMGLKAQSTKMTFDALATLGEAYPAILRLNNGNCLIVTGAGRLGEVPVILLRDPLAGDDELLTLDRLRLERAWDGAVVLAKRLYRGAEAADKPFGFATFIDEILRYRHLFRDVAMAAVVLSLLALAAPIFFQLVVDRVLLHNSIGTLAVLVVGVLFALVFETAFTYLRQYLVLYATMKIDARLNTRIFAKLLSLPMAYFEKTSTGVLVKNLQQTEKIRNFLTGQLFGVLLDGVTLVLLIPVMFFYSGVLAFVVLGFTLVLCAIVGLVLPVLQRRMLAVYGAEAAVQSFLVENIQGMRTVKSLALDHRKKREWGQRLALSINLRFDLMKLAIVVSALTQPLQKLMTVAVVGIGAYLVFNHDMQIGALIAFNIISMRVVQPLVQAAALAQQFQETNISVKMLGDVMNQPSEQGRGRRGVRIPITGRIDFSDIRFRYSPESSPALDKLSFAVPAGTIFGIMGRSGSGKTTVTRLLQGLHFAQEGIIKLDGHDLREMDLDWLRSNIGVVLQDNFLFHGTIRDNIAIGKSNATVEEVMRAARLAGATEFIERLPRGFDTVIEEGSANLSGGQKQRLAIARALLPDPPVLILDEATSALDAESEAIISSNLLSIAQGRTLIIISHRLSSLVPADQILVLDQGAAVDIGRHDDLLGRCALYRQMWQQQHRLG
jgi:ATP-binding cassette subfamily B protein